MKKVLLSLMAIAVALVSCKKEEQIVPEIKADKTEITVPTAGVEGKEIFIEFETNVDWTASLKEAIDWGSISNKKGAAGKGQVYVTADPNQTNDARVAVIVVKAGTAEKEFTVTQLQKDAFSLVSDSAEIGAEGGEVEIKVMTNIPYEVVLPDGASWLRTVDTKAYSEQVTKISVDAFDVLDDEREAVLTVTAAGFEPQEFTITQKGPESKIWGKKVTDWDGFVPADGARMAAYGDYILLANGSKIFALNAADGTVAQTISLPDGMKAQSLCVDEGGNVLFAANAKWAADETAEMFRIYTTKSLEQAPRLLVEYNSANIWCGEMGNVRVQGNIDANAVITAYASTSAYWMAWEVTDGKVGDLMAKTTPYTSNAFCGCVYPNGATLADGLWFIGYGGNYSLEYCADVAANTWVDSYVTGSGWMENYDCISSVQLGDKKYLAISASCHFNYDSTDLTVLDVTDPTAAEVVLTYPTDSFVSRDGDYANLDWTGAGTYADVCLIAKGETLYLYFIDANYGAAGCVMCK